MKRNILVCLEPIVSFPCQRKELILLFSFGLFHFTVSISIYITKDDNYEVLLSFPFLSFALLLLICNYQFLASEYQLLDSLHMVERYFWHLLQQLPLTYNKSGWALLVLLVLETLLAMVPPLGLMLCLYSTATCSRTSTSNMFIFSLGFIKSLTNAKANWSLGLNASSSLNIRQENRLLPKPCFLNIRALSGTSVNKLNYVHQQNRYIS